MWRIWNKLFGWDYVYWETRFDQDTSRIIFDQTNTPYIKDYDGYIPVSKLDSIIWLTCKPEKYLKNENSN